MHATAPVTLPGLAIQCAVAAVDAEKHQREDASKPPTSPTWPSCSSPAAPSSLLMRRWTSGCAAMLNLDNHKRTQHT